METQFTVLFDACVLYPAPLRDLLIELATRGMFWGIPKHLQNLVFGKAKAPAIQSIVNGSILTIWTRLRSLNPGALATPKSQVLKVFGYRWTNRIHDEWIRSLLKNRPDLKSEQLDRTRKLMDERVLDCLVNDYEDLIKSVALPDQHDLHVLAAAIKAQAQIIVTYNIKDFPIETLKKFEIEAQHPDTFLRYQLDLKLPVFLSSVKNIRQRLKKPPVTASHYLSILFPHLPQTVSILKQYENLI